VKKPVSKFAFQVHNLQRYAAAAGGVTTLVDMPLNSFPTTTTAAVGRCTLNQVDP
jgi:dihydroorotase-like cyclic amidohydrolase